MGQGSKRGKGGQGKYCMGPVYYVRADEEAAASKRMEL